jgi:hypothetical protein
MKGLSPMPDNEGPPRLPFRWSYWHLLLIPVLLPLCGFILIMIHFSLQCSSWRAPVPWPNSIPTVTTEHIAASMSTDSRTARYVVNQPVAIVEQYYAEQLQRLCLPNEVISFTTVYDRDSARPARQASCLLRGRSMPTPNGTPDQWDTDMDYRAQVYEAIKGTKQIFRVTIFSLAPDQQEVVQFEALTCP